MRKICELFGQELRVINIGLISFYEALKSQQIAVIHLDWKPPAGGNKKLISILENLHKK